MPEIALVKDDAGRVDMHATAAARAWTDQDWSGEPTDGAGNGAVGGDQGRARQEEPESGAMDLAGDGEVHDPVSGVHVGLARTLGNCPDLGLDDPEGDPFAIFEEDW